MGFLDCRGFFLSLGLSRALLVALLCNAHALARPLYDQIEIAAIKYTMTKSAQMPTANAIHIRQD